MNAKRLSIRNLLLLTFSLVIVHQIVGVDEIVIVKSFFARRLSVLEHQTDHVFHRFRKVIEHFDVFAVM